MRKAPMTALELTAPSLTVQGEPTPVQPAKASLCWTARGWQHQALRTVARENGISVNRLVLGIWAGESYDFSKAEVYPSSTAFHIMLVGDSEEIQSIRDAAQAQGIRVSPFLRKLIFESLSEAGKMPYRRWSTIRTSRRYRHVMMSDGEYRAFKQCAEKEGTDMAKILMACIEGRHERLEPLTSNRASRWRSISVRPLSEQWLALMEESMAAGMKFPTYLRSRLFVGVGDD